LCLHAIRVTLLATLIANAAKFSSRAQVGAGDAPRWKGAEGKTAVAQLSGKDGALKKVVRKKDCFTTMPKPKSKKRQAARAHNKTANNKPANIPIGPVGALKVRDACFYLGGINKLTLYRLVERELIKPSRGLRHLLFPVTELDRYLKETMEINPRPRKAS
jgi:hypothetical protein